MNVENKEIDETIVPEATPEESNDESSELDGDQSKNNEETVENLKKELERKNETLRKAEHTIVRLKKEEPKLDFEALKTDVLNEIKQELEPKMKELSKLEQLEKENRELKESLKSKKNISNAGGGASVKTEDNKPKPSKKDLEMASKYFGGNVERYMKYKAN